LGFPLPADFPPKLAISAEQNAEFRDKKHHCVSGDAVAECIVYQKERGRESIGRGGRSTAR
jgi:hypothetical protein